jgi:hypothetical protein
MSQDNNTEPTTPNANETPAPVYRKLPLAENAILTAKILVGAGLLGTALWGVSLWTAQ